MPSPPLMGLFNPGSVAVFGASDDEASVGGRIFAKLADGRFGGEITPINPRHPSVLGRPCHPDLATAGVRPDLAVIATPAATVVDVFRQCGKAGVRFAVVLSAGFAETGAEGSKLQVGLVEAARRNGIRFLGPNCVGLARPWLGLDATFLRTSAPPGDLALVSQSGALCSAISDWAMANALGFSAIVSLGNAAGIGFGTALDVFATDSKTRAILLYVEGIADAARFLSAMRVAARTKPVIVLKAGRHGESARAAHTHTGAMMGSDAVFDAALARAGAVRVHSFGQLFAAAKILAANRRARGNRLGIVTNGGGAGVLAADRAGDLGLCLASPSPATIAALDACLPAYWSHANPLDILGDAPPLAFGAAVTATMADPAYDGVLVMLTPQAMTEALAAAEAVVASRPQDTAKPLLACWMGESSVLEARAVLSRNGIPDFTTPERAVEAFSYLASHQRAHELALEVPPPLPEQAPADVEGARLIIDGALKDGRAMLSDIESKALLRAFGIPVNTTLAAPDAAAALVAAETVGFPVALKIASPDIPHKSDAGGVRLNVATAAELLSAVREIKAAVARARPEARLRGMTVERMAPLDRSRELVVGVARDPVFGPAIIVGAGGVMVELLRDRAIGLPPLTSVLARRMIDGTRVAALLEAVRNRPAADREAVTRVLLQVSDMVCELPEIVELDINPLIAGPEGVLAVDARIAVARPPARDGPYDHVPIHPYPRRLMRTEYLLDGTPLVIRPVRPEDAEGEAGFVRALSESGRRFRFMATLNELTPEMLSRFVGTDYRREMVLLAILRRDGRDEQHGVARYAVDPDEEACEFAVVVSDDEQHQGIGTRLMKALMDAARQRGLARMHGSVLADNTAMLQLVDELGFRRIRDPCDPNTVLIERDL